jgi:hypothetical protein
MIKEFYNLFLLRGAPTALFITCLTWCNNSYQGIDSGIHLLYHDKKIVLLSEDHTNAPMQDQHILEAFKIVPKDGGVHVLHERPGSMHFPHGHVSESIYELIKESGIEGLSIEDAEIRKVSGTAINIFSMPCPKFSLVEEERFFEGGPSLGEVTFDDIHLEYIRWLKSAEDFRSQKLSELDFSNYDISLDRAQSYYQDLITLLRRNDIKSSESILEVSRRLAHEANNEKLRAQLERNLLNIFCPLLDMYFFKNIFERPGKTIVIIAGGTHTLEIQNMITYQKDAETIMRCDINGTLLSYSQLEGLLRGDYHILTTETNDQKSPLTMNMFFVATSAPSHDIPPEKDKK